MPAGFSPTLDCLQLFHSCPKLNCLHTEWMDLDDRASGPAFTFDCAHPLGESEECVDANGQPLPYNYKSPSAAGRCRRRVG